MDRFLALQHTPWRLRLPGLSDSAVRRIVCSGSGSLDLRFRGAGRVHGPRILLVVSHVTSENQQ